MGKVERNLLRTEYAADQSAHDQDSRDPDA
jgi:hypothetical protein